MSHRISRAVWTFSSSRPTNVQRLEISHRVRKRALGAIRVATVDKLWRLQAPGIFYLMATASSELEPRGLTFFLSPNRLDFANRPGTLLNRLHAAGFIEARAGMGRSANAPAALAVERDHHH